MHRIHPLLCWSLILEVHPGLSGGAFILVFLLLLSSSFPLRCLGILHVDIFGHPGQESVELGGWLLSQAIEEVSVQQPCTKALALTSWDAVGTSEAAVLKRWKYPSEILLLSGGWRRGLIRSFGISYHWRIGVEKRTQFLEASDHCWG
ncbi:UNVERIFIED_CONTAM: hypothetical protein Sangu_2667000 [Sesamum angustifolium]|uniref:Uncharacterized protein n=1 Tax=Sesamum angustifolium TaxID=2727405 RepID=A0AAW2J377_9LAMI